MGKGSNDLFLLSIEVTQRSWAVRSSEVGLFLRSSVHCHQTSVFNGFDISWIWVPPLEPSCSAIHAQSLFSPTPPQRSVFVVNARRFLWAGAAVHCTIPSAHHGLQMQRLPGLPTTHQYGFGSFCTPSASDASCCAQIVVEYTSKDSSKCVRSPLFPSDSPCKY